MTLAYNAAWLAFSPDGRWIAIANGRYQNESAKVPTEGTVKLFRLADHRQGPPLLGHENNVNVLAFSADSTTLATGATDNTVVLHDVATGTTRATIRTATKPLFLAFDPLRPRLIVGYLQSETAAYDTVTGEPLASSTGLPDGLPFFDRAGKPARVLELPGVAARRPHELRAHRPDEPADPPAERGDEGVRFVSAPR